MNPLRILRAGLHDTLQGRGRPGQRAWGVPVSGAFDLDAHDLANALLGNDPDAVTLEVTAVGGVYEAGWPLAIALTGAPISAEIAGAGGGRVVLTTPQSATLGAGDRLILGGTAVGVRSYLAGRGGWRLAEGPAISGSDERLTTGSALLGRTARVPSRRISLPSASPLATDPIRVIDGPDFELGPGNWEGLVYRLGAQSDRMGLRFEGPELLVDADPNRLSAPVAPGAVQVAGGRPIILGPACGTMGGYPHIAHVISADMGRLAQLRPGEEVRLRRIEVEEARRIDQDHRREWSERLALIRAAVADDSCGRLLPW